MELLLTQDEAQLLKGLLERRLREIRGEIHHTALAAYRSELREEEARLGSVSNKLEIAAAVG